MSSISAKRAGCGGAVILFVALMGLVGIGAHPAWGQLNPFVDLEYSLFATADAPSLSAGAQLSGVPSIGDSLSLVDPPHTGPGPHQSASSQVAGTAQYGGLFSLTSVSGTGGLGASFSLGLGQGNTTVRFNDILTVVDNNVPPGTPVQLGFQWSLAGSVAAFGQVLNDGTASRGLSNVGASFQADVEPGTGLPSNLALDQQYCADTLLGGCGPPRPGRVVFPAGQVNFAAIDLSGIITTTPGARIDISGALSNDSTAQGAVDAFTCGNSTCFTDLSASAGSDFSHSVTLTVIPLTPGLSFVSASGALYLGPTNPVPEPAILLLVGSGLIALVGLRKKLTV